MYFVKESSVELKTPSNTNDHRFNLVITSAGDVTTAKLLYGKTTAMEVSVKRYCEDEYSEEAAVRAVCEKLFKKKAAKEAELSRKEKQIYEEYLKESLKKDPELKREYEILKGAIIMKYDERRLTQNKPVRELEMTELALNDCFIKDKNAMYRDYEEEFDARDFIKKVAKNFGIEILTKDPEDFDWMLFDWLEEGYDNPQGIIALLYSMIWSKAELYERLKGFENVYEIIDKELSNPSK